MLRRKVSLSTRCMLLVSALALLLPGLVAAQPTTTRVSVGPGGTEGNGFSGGSALSADGRWVAFGSAASNLVVGDTNGEVDVFVYDVHTATTTRVSVGPGGIQGSGRTYTFSISGDGRLVAFESDASNLVVGDTNNRVDVFVYDRLTGTTARVSVGLAGAQANDESNVPVISTDGRWVAFTSWASNLVELDWNTISDVFVYDRQAGTTTRVNVGPGGEQVNSGSGWPAISTDGRWVGFTSSANNLVAGDTNGEEDVFVRDLATGTTTRVNLGPGGTQANGGNIGNSVPAISADGRWVAFVSDAGNLVPGDTNGMDDAFVHDRQTGTTTRVSVGVGGGQGNGGSSFPGISADGRWVTFSSSASNLVPGDANGAEDVFVLDQWTETTTRVSVGSGGAEGNGASLGPAISADGRWVAFPSFASNLVAGDANGWSDVFVHDRIGLLPPTSPEGLVASSVAGNVVTLRWTIPSAEPILTGFVLEGGVSPGEVLASIPTGSAAPTFTFAAPAGSFYVRVHALNDTARSAASNEIRIHVNTPVVPSAPANLLGLVNGSTLALAWTNTYTGGAPTSLVLDVSGAITTSVPLGVSETFSFAGVPGGTYTLSVRAQNAAGSSPPSNLVTLTFPGVCSGPPGTPADVVAYRVGQTVFVTWSPAAGGPAPTSYLLGVTGAFAGGFATTGRALSGTVGPGSYTLSVIAVNPCGASAASPPQTVVVP